MSNTSADDGAAPPLVGRGGTILTLGILSLALGLACCPLFGPAIGLPAWVMAATDERRIRAGEISEDARRYTRIGKLLGIVGLFLGILLAIPSVLISYWLVQHWGELLEELGRRMTAGGR